MTTQRSAAELITALADNITGAITPEDMRDIVESLKTPHGGLYETVGTPTAIAVPGTYYKVNGTFALLPHNHLVTPDTTGRLTYTGVSDRHFHVVVSCSMTCASNNQTLGFELAHNGVPMPASQLKRRVGTGTDIGAVALHGDALLSSNDYIEIFLTNETSTAEVTMTNMYLYMMGMFS